MQQPCLFIGGNDDGLTNPAPDGAESLQWPSGIKDRETYNLVALSLGDVSVMVYVHESLTLEQALDRLVVYYKAWAVNRPGGRWQSSATCKSQSQVKSLAFVSAHKIFPARE